MIVEEFKAVKGFEGLYEVSNHGRLRSLNYNHTGEIRMLKKRLGKDGYLRACLFKNSKRKYCTVHRLVAEAFIPNPDGLPEVNHIDEDKTNNHVWNLEWCDRKYNINYGTRNERVSKRVYQYTLDGSFVRSYYSAYETERQTGIDQGNISRCCNNRPRYNSAGGYRWSYDPPTPTTNRTLF